MIIKLIYSFLRAYLWFRYFTCLNGESHRYLSAKNWCDTDYKIGRVEFTIKNGNKLNKLLRDFEKIIYGRPFGCTYIESCDQICLQRKWTFYQIKTL